METDPICPPACRSLLFVPGHRPHLAEKAAASPADTIVLDLQDAVPSTKKIDARKTARRLLDSNLFANRPVYVRTNELASGLTFEDIDTVVCKSLTGFVFPLIHDTSEIRLLAEKLNVIERKRQEIGPLRIIPLIETPIAVFNALDIARASTRTAALLFGCEDFLADLEIAHLPGEDALFLARALIVLAARAAGVEPIDAPFVDIHNLDGLKSFALQGRAVGMSGMLAMSPGQIPVIHEIFTPTPDEVDHARSLVEAAKSGEETVFVDRHGFISPPTLRRAAKLLARYRAIGPSEP